MKTYKFEIEYMVPEFAAVTVETKEDEIQKIEDLAMAEFTRMYPEAIDPEIVRTNSD